MTDHAEESIMRLAVYGTLKPGEANQWVLRPVGGEWVPGTINGWLFELTWGPAVGYPGLVLDADGPAVPVEILASDQLDKHWRDIDQFEGDGYRRVESTAQLADGSTVDVWVYEALTENDD